MRLGDNYKPITVKIPGDHKRELVRRFLEHPKSGRYGGPKSYADLVRDAIAQYLAPAENPAGVELRRKAIASGKPLDRGTFYIHRRTHANLDRSICGLVGLADECLTMQDANADCPKCERIIASNRKALSAPTPRRKRAPRPPGSSKKAGKR